MWWYNVVLAIMLYFIVLYQYSMGKFRIQFMEVRKRTICLTLFDHIFWGYSLKFRPYIWYLQFKVIAQLASQGRSTSYQWILREKNGVVSRTKKWSVGHDGWKVYWKVGWPWITPWSIRNKTNKSREYTARFDQPWQRQHATTTCGL